MLLIGQSIRFGGGRMTSTIQAYRAMTQNYARVLETTQSSSMVKRETAYYREKIGSISSIDEFLSDAKVYRYAMQAFGLDDFTYAKGFVRRALEGGIDDDKSLANRLTDPRFKEFVTAFNFARYGADTTKFSRTQEGTVDRYMRQQIEINAGRDNEAIRLALNFERKAPEVTSAYGLLANQALLKVVMTALNLPTGFNSYNIDKQADYISSKLNIADLKDPAKLKTFIERFATMWDVTNATTASTPQSTIAPITGSYSAPIALSVSLLAAVQGQFNKNR
jgi:hypothetical protein